MSAQPPPGAVAVGTLSQKERKKLRQQEQKDLEARQAKAPPPPPPTTAKRKGKGASEASADASPAAAASVDGNGVLRIHPRDGPQPCHVRGITNPANACFIASVFQTLAHCRHFVAVCAAVGKMEGAKERCPLVHGLGEWCGQYHQPQLGRILPSIMPPRFPKNTIQMTGSMQEDVHEFILSVFAAADKELVAAGVRTQALGGGGKKPKGGAGTADVQGKGWVTVGKKNEHLAIDDRANAATSAPAPITGLFTGTAHSQVRKQGGATQVTVEPFVFFPVDIGSSGVVPVEEALLRTTSAERVDTDDTSGRSIRKSFLFGTLPQHLVLQLKRWAITREGELVKLDNTVTLQHKLVIPDAAMAAATAYAPHERTYHLRAAVCHRGATPQSGHYVCYVAVACDGGATQWHLANDARVTKATLQDVVKESTYLLFYERAMS